MIQISTARLSHLPYIMNVEKESFIPQIREDEDVFKMRIETCPETFFVFERGDRPDAKKIIGYLCAEFLETIPECAEELKLNHLPNPDSPKNYIYISSFALLKEMHGIGLGKKLWNESIKKIEDETGIKKILLLVNESWKNARHIYENAGFKQISVFKNFFPTENNTFTNGILMLRS